MVKKNIVVKRAFANSIPYMDDKFDVVTLTSVYEHIPPEDRFRSIEEIYRVIRPQGILVGQIPNMNFPIEVHSRLPLQQFLPRRMGNWYLKKFSPVSWRNEGMNWYRVGPKNLIAGAKKAGFASLQVEKFNYPKEILSTTVQKFYFFVSVSPLGYIFCFQK